MINDRGNEVMKHLWLDDQVRLDLVRDTLCQTERNKQKHINTKISTLSS